MDIIDEIRHKIDIVDLVARYTTLKKAGRNYKGLCPFHKEKTPSFMVSPDKQIAYCFGCHRGGDIFKFVEEVERLDFREALAWLARQAGVAITALPPEQRSEKEALKELHARAAQLWQGELARHEGAQQYLHQRGLTPDTIASFEIGYAPGLYDFLWRALGDVEHKKLVTAGLVSARDVAGQDIFDRFRNRIMFPIRNVEGEIIAFTGRILGDDPEQAKYVNSPETPLYHKGRVIYNLDKAKNAIREHDAVVLMEGQMDVISAYQAGYKHVVAVSGTALTEDQLRLLKRYTKRLYFCFDSDAAGQAATYRSAELALGDDFELFLVQLVDKDPDECLRRDPAAFGTSLQTAPRLLDQFVRSLSTRFDLAAATGKKAAAAWILPLLSRVPSYVERDHYLQQVAGQLGVTVATATQELQRLSQSRVAEAEPATPVRGPGWTAEELLVALAYNFPEEYPRGEVEWRGAFAKKIYKAWESQYNLTRVAVEPADLTAEEAAQLNILRLYVEEKYADFSASEIVAEMQKLREKINQSGRDSERRQLLQKLKTTAPDSPEYRQILAEYQALIS